MTVARRDGGHLGESACGQILDKLHARHPFDEIGHRRRRGYCGLEHPLCLDPDDLGSESDALRWRDTSHPVEHGGQDGHPFRLPRYGPEDRQFRLPTVDCCR